MKYPAREININDDKWTYQLVSKKEFKQRHPGSKDEIAMTDPVRFAIDFTKEAVTQEIAVHELFHAYHVYFFLNSAQISLHDHEEIIAEFLGSKINELMRKARIVYRNLKGDIDGRG